MMSSLLAQLVSGAQPDGPRASSHLWDLFSQSFDAFSVVLLLGSLVMVAVIIRGLLEIRAGRIVPAASERTLRELSAQRRWAELRLWCARDESLPGRVVLAAMQTPAVDPSARRGLAETAAAQEIGDRARVIEPLSVIGTLAPLVGLAGTVWGMILAFTSLGASGGQAEPQVLSAGISKALFHTLLGLCLAIPALAAFALLRGRLDRLCTRGLLTASEVVEMLPSSLPAPGEER